MDHPVDVSVGGVLGVFRPFMTIVKGAPAGNSFISNI